MPQLTRRENKKTENAALKKDPRAIRPGDFLQGQPGLEQRSAEFTVILRFMLTISTVMYNRL